MEIAEMEGTSIKRAAIYCRVSTEEQKIEGTSLDTQKEACLRYAKEKGFEVPSGFVITESYSGLTLQRPGLQQILSWIRNKAIETLIIHASDRLSRDPYDLLTVIRDCDLHEVHLLCVTENMDKGDTGDIVNFVRGWASGVEAKKIKERTIRGKLKHAQNGDIPAGFGRYGGYPGLSYDKERKMLVWVPGKIELAKRILSEYLTGNESISSITRSLQQDGITGTAGKLIQRSAVARALSHAKVYAGTLTWKGIEIQGKVDKPIISAQDAEIILQRLRRNKELSYGFGKRKWLSGRVLCGVCGRRYNLDLRKGCHCNGNDNRIPSRCDSPRISFSELSTLAYGEMIKALCEPASVIDHARKEHESWESERQVAEQQYDRKLDRDHVRDKRRKLVSYQHELGKLTNEEFLARLDIIDKEAKQDEAFSLEDFLKTEPPTPEQIQKTYDRLREIEPLFAHWKDLIKNPNDKQADNLAEAVGLKIMIMPSQDEDVKFYAWVKMDLPISEQQFIFPDDESHDALVIVSQSSPSCARRRRLPLMPASHAPGL